MDVTDVVDWYAAIASVKWAKDALAQGCRKFLEDGYKMMRLEHVLSAIIILLVCEYLSSANLYRDVFVHTVTLTLKCPVLLDQPSSQTLMRLAVFLLTDGLDRLQKNELLRCLLLSFDPYDPSDDLHTAKQAALPSAFQSVIDAFQSHLTGALLQKHKNSENIWKDESIPRTCACLELLCKLLRLCCPPASQQTGHL